MGNGKQENTGQGSILIEAPVEAVFDFISDPETRWEFITPLEVHRQIDAISGAVLLDRYEVEIAGRTLRSETRIVSIDRPRLVIRDVQGDVNSTQIFSLSRRDGSTELTLVLSYEVEPDWPAYFREQPTAYYFSQTLVDQMLEEIRTVLEVEQTFELELH